MLYDAVCRSQDTLQCLRVSTPSLDGLPHRFLLCPQRVVGCALFCTAERSPPQPSSPPPPCSVKRTRKLRAEQEGAKRRRLSASPAPPHKLAYAPSAPKYASTRLGSQGECGAVGRGAGPAHASPEQLTTGLATHPLFGWLFARLAAARFTDHACTPRRCLRHGPLRLPRARLRGMGPRQWGRRPPAAAPCRRGGRLPHRPLRAHRCVPCPAWTQGLLAAVCLQPALCADALGAQLTCR
jgi:hypothetical protein